MLGREPVSDCEDGAASQRREMTMHGVVGLEVTEEPSTAVKEHEQRQAAILRWAVQTNRDSVGTKIADFGELHARQLLADHLHVRAKCCDCLAVERWQGRRRANHGGDVGIEHMSYFLLNGIDVNACYETRKRGGR